MPSSTKRKAKPKVTFDYGTEDIGLETLERVKQYANEIVHFSKQQSDHIITFDKFQKKKEKSEAEPLLDPINIPVIQDGTEFEKYNRISS